MKRIGAIVVALAVFVPVGDAMAVPDAPLDPISQPFVALRGADRIGNATTADDAVPPSEPTAPAVPPASVEMQAVLALVNIERTSRGLVPLRFSANLNEAALGHTLDQAAQGDTFHFDPLDGSGPADRLTAAGYVFSRWGENVAAGFPTAAAVMQGWMNSSGHCKNILNPAFTEIGVGFVDGGVRYNYFWTQAFARPKGVAQPPGTYNDAWC